MFRFVTQFRIVVFTGLILCIATFAIGRKALKRMKPAAVLLEAYTFRVLPGVPEAQPETETHFVVGWQATRPPERFFWKTPQGVVPCTFSKAHAATPGNQPGNAYVIDMSPGILKGDTLLVTPVKTAAAGVTPKELLKKPANSLFFRMKGTAWVMLPVAAIRKKPDITLP